MNKTIFLSLFNFLLIILFTSCEISYREVELDELELKDSLWYEKESNQLFTGKYLEKYSNDKIKGTAIIENGKVSGKTEAFYKNSVKSAKIYYKDGILHGESAEWFENGQLSAKAKYHNGKLDGYSEKFFENGSYDGYSYYTMGELDSLFRFFSSGQKKVELKNFDKENSTLKEWDSTGAIIFQITLVDGEYVGNE